MLHRYLCETCGGNLTKVDESHYRCESCGNEYSTEKVENYVEKMKEVLDDAKLEMISKARKNLYSAISNQYISKHDVIKWCDEVKKYLPDDFQANFYYDFINAPKKEVAKNIRKIDVKAHFELLEPLIVFVAKSLEKSYVAALKDLIERAYKFYKSDIEKYIKYTTMVENEAEKLDKGMYVTKQPRKAFVAYSSKDSDKAIELVEVLESQGISCFISLRNLRHGVGSQENYASALKEAMDNCMSFVFVSSMNSRNIECDAYQLEMPYIMQCDKNNAPGNLRNYYKNIPQEYKKPRVEYRIEESSTENFADDFVDEFFDGYERAYTIKDVAHRILEQARRAAEIVPMQQKVEAPKAQTSSVDALVKRIFMFLEDGEWNSADEYCEKVLDQDPENAQAYLGKLMAELKVKKQDDLKNCAQPFDKNGNYQKVIRFADKSLKTTVTGYIETINNRRLDGIYANAVSSMKTASTINHYEKAISTFETIKGWKDADDLIKECQDNIKKIKIKAENDRKDKILNNAKAKMNSESDQDDEETPNFGIIYSDCQEIDDLIDDLIKERKKYQEALSKLETIRGWKNADDLIKECQNKIEKLKIEEENKRVEKNAKRKKAAEERRLEEELKAEIARKEAERIAKKKRKKKIIIATIIFFAVALIAFLIILFMVITSNNKYNNAISLMESGNTVEAYELFISLGEYKDSADKAKSLYDKYKVEKSKKFEVGNYVFFGSYEQDNKLSNGKEDIEWLVLDVQDGKALLISKYALDCKQYNTHKIDVTWETCSLRKWLNKDFINTAFSNDEKAKIPTVTVSADKNPTYDTNPGNSTQDRVFLLSISEVEKYFSSDTERVCKPTEYVKANNAYTTNNGNCMWWLRSAGSLQNSAAYVYPNTGGVEKIGGRVNRDVYAVRPAMWIDLES